MTLSIGKIIYKLRKEKGITQEQLATAVGVSTPAVSKWETGNAYPDITLLAPISRFLGTTIDILLSFEADLTPDEVMDISRECANAFETLDFYSAMALCDKYLKAYPTNLFLKFRIGSMLQRYLHLAASEEKMLSIINKSIKLVEASSESEDFEIKQASIYILSSLYTMTEEFDKAESILKTLTKSIMNPDMMLASIYYMQGKVEDSIRTHQQCLYTNINNTLLCILSLSNVALKKGNFEEALELAELHRNTIKLYNLDSLMLNTNSLLYLDIYAAMKNEDLSLKYLEEFTDNALFKQIKTFKLSDLKLFSLTQTTEPLQSPEFLKQTALLSITMNDKYDFIKDTDRYKKSISKLM